MTGFARILVAVMAALTLLAPLTVPPARADDRLDFTGTTVDGAPFNGASLAGRPAVLWFWTPWCPFCNQEGPSVSHVAAANPQVTFVGIAARADAAAMRDFIAKYHLGFTNLNDADGSLWARFNVPWQPAYLFVAADGTSTFVNNPTSAMSESDLAGRVAALGR
ncbi:MAG TPA: redoxin family protein [Mycobacterium sp.]|nr:redoxin family protein [Mycobacterium sp.]